MNRKTGVIDRLLGFAKKCTKIETLIQNFDCNRDLKMSFQRFYQSVPKSVQVRSCTDFGTVK